MTTQLHTVHHAALEGAPLDRICFHLPRRPARDLRHITLECALTGARGPARIAVLDYAERGVGLAASDLEGVPRAGERVESVEIHAGDRCLYRGPARVERTPDEPGRAFLALTAAPLDVDAVAAVDRRAGLLAQLEPQILAARGLLDGQVPIACRAAIADLVVCLESLRATLDALNLEAEEPALASEVLTRIEEGVAADFLRLVAAFGASLTDASDDARAAAATCAQRALHPLLLQAPIPRHAYEKPLGYAGDFQLMRLIYGEADRGETMLGRLVNRLSCRLPVTRAGVDRLAVVEGLLRSEIEARAGRPVRLCSLACGPAEEVHRMLTRGAPLPADTPLELTLIDQDEDALAFCARRFVEHETDAARTPVRLHPLHTAVKAFVTEPEQLDPLLPPQDVIFTVGLFDYLPGPVARTLVAHLLRFLAPGGTLVVGNFAPHDASAFLDHVLDWRLIYRDEAALRRLADKALSMTGADCEVEVKAERRGLHLLLCLRRADSAA